MIKSFFRNVTPPLIWNFGAWLYRTPERNINFLFDSGGEHFKNVVKKSAVYGEYGVGKSTRWILRNTDVKIVAVDTDITWINLVKKDAIDPDRLTIEFVNVGPLESWGRPKTLDQKSNFIVYAESIWTHGEFKPTLVLIDGRFRISCFFMCLAKADSGTLLVFDDYIMRPLYSIVEKYLKPTGLYGRQAHFEIPDFSQEKKDEFYSLATEYSLVID